MAMTKRIATILTEFKAGGVSSFKKATQAVSGAAAKVGEKFSGIGQKAKAALDRARTAALSTTTALTRIGVQGALGATRMSGALARLTLRATAVATAIAAIGKASLVAFSRKAIDDTAEDLKMLRQTASFLAISPEEASYYTNLAEEAGLARDEFRDAVGAFREAQGEAVADPESNYAKIFRDAGIRLTKETPLDREGLEAIRTLRDEMQEAGASAQDIQKAVAGIRMELGRTEKSARPTMQVLEEMAVKLAGVTSEERAFFLSQVFGGSDSLKMSELLDRLALDRRDIALQMSESQRQDLLVTRRQVRLAQQLDVARGAFSIAFRSIQRQIFVRVAPVLITMLNRITRFFRDANVELGSLVANGLGKIYNLAHDVIKVFTGFDLNRWFGARSVDVEATWLFKIKRVLDQVVAGIGPAIRGMAALARDVGRIYGSVMAADPGKAEDIAAGIETGVGLALLKVTRAAVGFVGLVQRATVRAFSFVADQFQTRVVAPIRNATLTSKVAFDAGKGLGDVEGDLTRLALAFRYLVDYAIEFGKAWKAVFIDGADAPEGFGALQDIRDGLGPVLRTIGEIGRGFVSMFGWLDDLLRRLTGLGLVANLVLGGIFLRLTRIVVGAVMSVGRFGIAFVKGIGKAVMAVGKLAKAFGQSGLGRAAGAVLGFMGRLVAGFVKVMLTGAKLLVGAGVSFMRQGAGAALNAFVGGFNRSWTGAFNAIGNAFFFIADKIKLLGNLVGGYLIRAFGWLLNGALSGSIGLVSGAFNVVGTVISSLVSAVGGMATAFGSMLSSVIPGISSIGTAIGGVIARIVGSGGLLGALLAVGGLAKKVLGAAAGAVTGLAGSVLGGGASTAAGAAAGAAGGVAARSGIVAGAAGLAGRAGSVGAVAAGGLLTGAAIGEAINRWILEPYLQGINDVDVQEMIDRSIKPMLENTPSLGRPQSMRDVYETQSANLDVGTMTAGTIDLDAAQVNVPANNLRPVNLFVAGQQIGELQGSDDQVARIRRSQGASLGVTL